MRRPDSIEFNAECISSINDLLNARELTGEMPETMPTGLYNEDNSSNDGNCNCNCNCNDCNGNCIIPVYAATFPGSGGSGSSGVCQNF